MQQQAQACSSNACAYASMMAAPHTPYTPHTTTMQPIITAVALGCLLGASAIPHVDQKITTFDGVKSTTQKWLSENDPVMGGRSVGSFEVHRSAGIGRWEGEVKVVPKLQAPGFCSIRTRHEFPDLSAAQGLLITARHGPEAEVTKIKVSMISSVHNSPREGDFEAPLQLTSTWATHFVPFVSMVQDWRGQKEGGAPTKEQLENIHGLGFLSDGVAGKFLFEIRTIAIGSAPVPPPPSPPPAVVSDTLFSFGTEGVKPWSVTDDPVMGGRSHSSFVVGNDEAGNHNVGIFAGTVAIVPFLHAPGFCNAHVHFPAVDASDYDAIEITVRNRSPSLNAFKSSFGGKGVPQVRLRVKARFGGEGS